MRAFLSSGRHGFVVAVTNVCDIGKGLIRDGTGFVTFPVKYDCVVFRPFRGEILESVVTMVNKVPIPIPICITYTYTYTYAYRYIFICLCVASPIKG